MIKLFFKEKLQSLDKNGLQIAQETGINRNTITSLMKNDISGVKFETLEKLCGTYGWKIEDLIQFVVDQKLKYENIYRQEGEGYFLTMEAPAVACGNFSFPLAGGAKTGYQGAYIFFEKGIGYWYWDADSLRRFAIQFYEDYGAQHPKMLQKLLNDFEHSCRQLEQNYFTISSANVATLSNRELNNSFKDVWNQGQQFWKYSIFIDTFDSGTDQKIIEGVSKKYNLSIDEVAVLTTPMQMPFSYELELDLLKAIDRLITNETITKSMLEKTCSNSEGIKQILKRFDYVKSNYATVKHLKISDAVEIVSPYIGERTKLQNRIAELVNYSVAKASAVNRVLKEKGLKSNPLEFFSLLTYWRERRKQVNLMSIHLYQLFIEALEQRIGIPASLLKNISSHEFESALSGLVSREVLAERSAYPFMLCIDGSKQTLIVGEEAQALRNQFEEKLSKGKFNDKTLSGTVACRGYAKGIARVISSEDEFSTFKEGEILVTGMTRPEFVPIRKKSVAIVTNEGGVTCHAAIVSRELGKPCIIGTSRATEVIKTGDLVEVRANHGTVRVLS